MDEVQMQGSGTIASVACPRLPSFFLSFFRKLTRYSSLSFYRSEMVSLLPRRSSFAVSGTPARNKVEDLQQALRFALLFRRLSPLSLHPYASLLPPLLAH